MPGAQIMCIAIDPQGEPGTVVLDAPRTRTGVPWSVIIHDDPVNTIDYVVLTIRRIFGYGKDKAFKLTMEVHHKGRSAVWAGAKEKAEMFVHQLHAAQLQASLERAGE